MKQQMLFPIFGFVTGLFMSACGALWAIRPHEFVIIYRRVAFAEKAAKTDDWRKSVVSPSARIFATLLFIFGCVAMVISYRIARGLW